MNLINKHRLLTWLILSVLIIGSSLKPAFSMTDGQKGMGNLPEVRWYCAEKVFGEGKDIRRVEADVASMNYLDLQTETNRNTKLKSEADFLWSQWREFGYDRDIKAILDAAYDLISRANDQLTLIVPQAIEQANSSLTNMYASLDDLEATGCPENTVLPAFNEYYKHIVQASNSAAAATSAFNLTTELDNQAAEKLEEARNLLFDGGEEDGRLLKIGDLSK